MAIDNIHLNEQTGRTAAADERSRIARELHDSLTQTLFTASVLAEATPRIWNKRPGHRAAEHGEAQRVDPRRVGRDALLAARIASRTRRRTNPSDQLLNTLAEATRARSNMAVSLSIEEDRDLPADVTMTLYRIAQEALNNVIKHAEATRVDIMLLNQPARVALHIRDDGRGFDPQVIPAGHMGISIMAERAQKIGGDLQIQSQPGRGAEVSVTWPVSDRRGRTMADPRPIRVMIVDDHPIVRDGLKNMLLAFDDLELVGEAADGSQARGPLRADSARCDPDGHGDAGDGWHCRHARHPER